MQTGLRQNAIEEAKAKMAGLRAAKKRPTIDIEAMTQRSLPPTPGDEVRALGENLLSILRPPAGDRLMTVRR